MAASCLKARYRPVMASLKNKSSGLTIVHYGRILCGPWAWDHSSPDTDPKLIGTHRGPKVSQRACNGPIQTGM